ncbi:MAG TPA: UbiD family decarboxylase [Thermoproteales archaeon]|nr:UbiD family decarboxylase [Thermoproteales archaeon]
MIIFPNIKGYKMPLISNILSTRKRFLKSLGAENSIEAYRKLFYALENPLKLKVSNDAPFLDKVISLTDIPVLKFFKEDGGRYITSGIIIAKDYETGALNASFHRMMVLDDKRLAVRIVPRHLYKMLENARKKGKDLEVAIVIGVPPIVEIAAACSPPYGVFELEVANRLAEGNILGYEFDNGLIVPVESEIVMLGKIKGNIQVREGPFVDILRIYDIARKQPLIEIEKIYCRRDAYYRTILPGGSEHRLLMGFHREANIWKKVSEVVPKVHGVRLTKGGGGWLSCVISIEKQTEGDAKNAILAAFAAHPSLKMVVVIDPDINIDDPSDIEWALATRFQASKDLVVIRNVRGSSLDPSADQINLLTDKIGFDATMPIKNKQKYLKVY